MQEYATGNGQFPTAEKFVEITAELIAGAGAGMDLHSYTFMDEDIEKGMVYYYYVRDIALAAAGKSSTSVLSADELQHGPVSIVSGFAIGSNGTVTTDIANEQIPTEFALEQNHPNPFTPGTTIHFSVPIAGHVKLTIFNMAGQVVNELINKNMSAGMYSVQWQAVDQNIVRVASGLYLYRLETGGKVLQKKMLLLK